MKLYKEIDKLMKKSEIYLYYPTCIFGAMMFVAFFISPFYDLQIVMLYSSVILIVFPLFAYMLVGFIELILEKLDL